MKVSSISNLIGRSFLVFIIIWLWTSYYIRSFFVQLLVSTILTVGFNYVISYFYKRKIKTQIASKQERTHLNQVILQLKFMTKAQTHTLLKKALPEKVKEYVSQRKFTLAPQFHKPILTEHDIIECIKSAPKNSKVIICAEYFPPTVSAFACSLDIDIVLMDAEAVYKQILAPTQTFPEIKVQTKKSAKRTLREIKSLVFNQSRTKSYFITGTVILFSSLIIRLHIYYIIFATLVFSLALSSYFSPSVSKDLFDI